MKTFFPASVIAFASNVCPKTAHRRARRAAWAKQKFGNRFDYAVPRSLRLACAALSVKPSIFNQPRTQRELVRAAAVLAFYLYVRRNPKRGLELTLRDVASDFRHLHKFSPGILRRWVRAVEHGGVAALREQKVGRVGRKSSRLERILR